MVQSRWDDGEIQAHKSQTYVRGSLIISVVVLAACRPVASPTPTPSPTETSSPHALAATGTAAPRPLSTLSPMPSAEPTESPSATSGPTAAPRVGILSFPSVTGDAGNWALQAGAEITILWEEAPPGAERYEFTLVPEDGEPAVLLGEDLDSSDGVSILWTVPEHLAGSFEAAAYFADDGVIHAKWSGMVYSGTTPPAGICTLSASTIGVVQLYAEPDFESAVVAYLLLEYTEVLGRTGDDWYLVDASAASMLDAMEPKPGTGWVTPIDRIDLHGPCEDLPFIVP